MKMMPIREMLMRTMIMGKIRFTADKIEKKLFQTKIAEARRFARWHKFVMFIF